MLGHLPPSKLPEPNDWEVSGPHRQLTESAVQDLRIRDLEEENYSLRLQLVIAKAALKFSPAQVQALKDLIRDAGQIIEKERQRAKAA